ncbi:MAG: right-handed parallel beta-helix repeat-containing protein [Armatimonadetes bacterium]|nr:right-handed parallel beta-helix repeat-containing protein [Armatimonadota bacterium]
MTRSILTAFLFCLLLASAIGGQGTITLYVSPKGSDSFSGSGAGRSMATPEGALLRMRQLRRQKPDSAARIVLRGGTYHLARTLVIEPQDSGLTLESAPGEEAVLSGGRLVTGWRPYRSGIFQADLSGLDLPDLEFRELYLNGKRQPMARVPNLDPRHPRHGGWLINTEMLAPENKTRFRYRPGELDPARWKNPERALVIFHDSLNYEVTWAKLKSADAKERIIEADRGVYNLGVGCPYYLANLFEEMDAPGEWYADPQTRFLYFQPPGGKIGRAAVTVPALQEVVSLRGDAAAGRFVERVRLSRIRIRDARGSGVKMAGAKECAVIGCYLRNLYHGVLLAEDTHGCRVAGCDITQTGCDGVSIQGIPRQHEQVSHHEIENNYIWDFGYGAIHNRAAGVWLIGASYCRVLHNRIHDGPRYAIGTDVGSNHVIAYNDCHHVNLETCDSGIIETATALDWGLSIEEQLAANRKGNWDNDIHHNLLHDSGGWGPGPSGGYTFPVFTWGIYLDLHSSGWRVHDNVIYNTVLGAYMVNGGIDNLFENNICLDSRDSQLFLEPWPRYSMSGNRVERNIIGYRDTGRTWLYNLPNYKPEYMHFSYNLVWPSGGQPRLSAAALSPRRSWEEWLKSGQDQESLVADPLLGKGWKPRPGSPAGRIGFRAIDLSRVGLYASPERYRWPRPEEKMIREPARYGPQPAETAQPSLRNYEASQVDNAEQRAQYIGEEPPGRTVRVSDDTAASGKHSLKFTDAKAEANDWIPCITYMLDWGSGTVEAGFDLRWEPGAVFVYEWRDHPHTYHNGPYLQVDASGQLSANAKPLLKLPSVQWVRFDISYTIGKGRHAYDLTVKLPGKAPQRFKNLPCSPEFDWLNCAVIASMADDPSVFYIDNLTFKQSRR